MYAYKTDFKDIKYNKMISQPLISKQQYPLTESKPCHITKMLSLSNDLSTIVNFTFVFFVHIVIRVGCIILISEETLGKYISFQS